MGGKQLNDSQGQASNQEEEEEIDQDMILAEGYQQQNQYLDNE
jgi:hypothetical protein